MEIIGGPILNMWEKRTILLVKSRLIKKLDLVGWLV